MVLLLDLLLHLPLLMDMHLPLLMDMLICPAAGSAGARPIGAAAFTG